MLDVSDLQITYEATRAVDGVSLEVSVGEIVCLLGPNGAGKTSVLRAISSVVGFQGTIRFDGAEISSKPAELARLGLIHVPEGRHVFPTLSVHENLQMGDVARAGRPRRASPDDVYDLFPALVPLRKRLGFALSGGEQQMVALGRALVAAPRMLLLDEPSLGLAPSVVHTVYKALHDVASDYPVLLVEQNTTEALNISSRGYVMAGGRIVMSGTSEQLSDRSAMLAGYLGQSDVEKPKN